MVDLPESMKTGGFDPQQAQAQLEAEKNRARRAQMENDQGTGPLRAIDFAGKEEAARRNQVMKAAVDRSNIGQMSKRINQSRQNTGQQPLGAPVQTRNVPGSGGAEDQSTGRLRAIDFAGKEEAARRSQSMKSAMDRSNIGQMAKRINEVREGRGRQPIGAPLQMPTVPGGAGANEQQPWSRENDPLTRAENTADQLNAQRNAARGKTPPSEKKLAKEKKKQDKLDALSIAKDYPNPITLRGFVAFAGIAASQDATPLLLDILGVGWIFEYVHLPFTWIAYWYLIIRRAPKSMKRKFWQRTLLVTCVGWIPVVGQFIPEWTATAIGAYIVISMYERRKAYESAGKASQANKGSEAKTPAPAGVA